MNGARELLIQMNNLKNIDDIYTFYYDETNNVRKLYLNETENGLNVSDYQNFVLAGIFHQGKKKEIDFSPLIKSLNLQKTVKEIKFKNLATGDFLTVLESSKLRLVFEWLLNNDIFIHYCNLDIFYWSITDIVDSILAQQDFNDSFIPYHREIKNDLYNVIKRDSNLCMKMLYGYEYPNVYNAEIGDFIQDILNLITKNEHKINVNLTPLKNFIARTNVSDSLSFIMDNDSNILIDSLLPFYLQKINLFKNSEHFFDDEKTIVKELSKFSLRSDVSNFGGYHFINSKIERAIQISDVVCGFLGKYFTYINKTEIEKIIQNKSELNSTQCENLSLFRELINKSDKLSNAALHMVVCDDDLQKNIIFLC
jgi:hypothetical protein